MRWLIVLILLPWRIIVWVFFALCFVIANGFVQTVWFCFLLYVTVMWQTTTPLEAIILFAVAQLARAAASAALKVRPRRAKRRPPGMAERLHKAQRALQQRRDTPSLVTLALPKSSFAPDEPFRAAYARLPDTLKALLARSNATDG